MKSGYDDDRLLSVSVAEGTEMEQCSLLQPGKWWLDSRSFSLQVVKHLNRLPGELMQHPSLDAFKSRECFRKILDRDGLERNFPALSGGWKRCPPEALFSPTFL